MALNAQTPNRPIAQIYRITSKNNIMPKLKKNAIRYNNPFKIRVDIDDLLGQRTGLDLDDFCEFTNMRYGWRVGFILLFQSYERGNKTFRKILTDLYTADKSLKIEEVIKRLSELKVMNLDKPLPSPADNACQWQFYAEFFVQALNNTDIIDCLNECVIGWAMAYVYLFDENIDYRRYDL